MTSGTVTAVTTHATAYPIVSAYPDRSVRPRDDFACGGATQRVTPPTIIGRTTARPSVIQRTSDGPSHLCTGKKAMAQALTAGTKTPTTTSGHASDSSSAPASAVCLVEESASEERGDGPSFEHGLDEGAEAIANPCEEGGDDGHATSLRKERALLQSGTRGLKGGLAPTPALGERK